MLKMVFEKFIPQWVITYDYKSNVMVLTMLKETYHETFLKAFNSLK